LTSPVVSAPSKEWGLAAIYTQECSSLIMLVSIFTGIEPEPHRRETWQSLSSHLKVGRPPLIPDTTKGWPPQGGAAATKPCLVAYWGCGFGYPQTRLNASLADQLKAVASYPALQGCD
jgi:hypothetical protein